GAPTKEGPRPDEGGPTKEARRRRPDERTEGAGQDREKAPCPMDHAETKVGPMELELTEEQKMVQQMARDFAEREVRPKARELDREGRWPAELVARMAELGLLGVAVPSEHGGAGADNVSYALAMEEIARACASTAVIMSVNNSLVCDPLLKFGNVEQKKRWREPLAAGRM